MPQFVEREFREFLLCGVFEAGVARFQCEGCGLDHLLPFSGKGRAWCPSCGGRRMTERAAHLVDAVLPWVPVRQWVLTMPYRLRYQMAWNHGLSRAVLRVYTRALLDVYRRDARTRGIVGGQTGMVTAVQRAGGALNVNVHFHTLVLDGVFTEDSEGALAFHPAPGPSDTEVAAALATIRQRVQRLLVRHGLEPADDAAGPASMSDSTNTPIASVPARCQRERPMEVTRQIRPGLGNRCPPCRDGSMFARRDAGGAGIRKPRYAQGMRASERSAAYAALAVESRHVSCTMTGIAVLASRCRRTARRTMSIFSIGQGNPQPLSPFKPALRQGQTDFLTLVNALTAGHRPRAGAQNAFSLQEALQRAPSTKGGSPPPGSQTNPTASGFEMLLKAFGGGQLAKLS